MIDIPFKSPDKDTDFSKIDKTKYNWDLVINGKPYDIWRLDGFIHLIGGKYGNNDLWCCPADEEPSFENLIGFDGEAPTWGIQASKGNYVKTKWGDTECRGGGGWTITRNGVPFYEGGCRDLEYGLSKAQAELVKIQEHPIGFGMRDWEDELVGRHIYYHEQPAIITSVIGDGQLCAMIAPDKQFTEWFKPHCWYSESDGDFGWDEEWQSMGAIKDDLLILHIWWFRDPGKCSKSAICWKPPKSPQTAEANDIVLSEDAIASARLRESVTARALSRRVA
jgi:hypothetical protein